MPPACRHRRIQEAQAILGGTPALHAQHIRTQADQLGIVVEAVRVGQLEYAWTWSVEQEILMKRAKVPFWSVGPTYISRTTWHVEHQPPYGPAFWSPTYAYMIGGSFPRPTWPMDPPELRYSSLPTNHELLVPSDGVFNFIANQRLQAFFETEAPGSFEYFPVKLVGPQSEKLGPYYVCRFLHTWDCLHPYSWDEDETGRFVQMPIVDVSKIPPDGKIGTVKHYAVEQLFRDDVKRAFVRAGFVGIRFYPTSIATDPQSMQFEHVNKPRDPEGPGGGTLES
jgi:hypothetical protein